MCVCVTSHMYIYICTARGHSVGMVTASFIAVLDFCRELGAAFPPFVDFLSSKLQLAHAEQRKQAWYITTSIILRK